MELGRWRRSVVLLFLALRSVRAGMIAVSVSWGLALIYQVAGNMQCLDP
jgi:hypothetical protein